MEENGPLSIQFFRLHRLATTIRPASTRREWMDGTDQRFAYRCTPILIANASGWEFTCPFAFEVEWDGGDGRDAIRIHTEADAVAVETMMGSHFGHGIVTFHTGWLMRSSPGWTIWARGSPNRPKDGISPLEGIVETDWLPFPFTMNWRFTAPCSVRFEEGEPFCFVTPTSMAAVDGVEPTMHEIGDDPELRSAHSRWAESRADFNAGLVQRQADDAGDKWQKKYLRGSEADAASATHLTKRSFAAPRWTKIE